MLRLARKRRDGLALHHDAELERIADEIEIDVRDLHAALRHRDDQSFGFEARDQLADRAERLAGDRDKLALRDELARRMSRASRCRVKLRYAFSRSFSAWLPAMRGSLRGFCARSLP